MTLGDAWTGHSFKLNHKVKTWRLLSSLLSFLMSQGESLSWVLMSVAPLTPLISFSTVGDQASGQSPGHVTHPVPGQQHHLFSVFLGLLLGLISVHGE